jgi:hypothetical protein
MHDEPKTGGANRDAVQPTRDVSFELYQEHRKQAWQDIQTSTDQFDRSLLTLSSGALVLSLAFIKDLVPLKDAVGVYWLYCSWVSLAVCIVVTLGSFLVSVQAQKAHLVYYYKYYIEKDEKYLHRQSCWSRTLGWCSFGGALLFSTGLLCTMIFAYENIRRLHP